MSTSLTKNYGVRELNETAVLPLVTSSSMIQVISKALVLNEKIFAKVALLLLPLVWKRKSDKWRHHPCSFPCHVGLHNLETCLHQERSGSFDA